MNTRRSNSGSHIGLHAEGIQHQVDRTYREGGVFQWVRETLVNALEAGAKRVHFGVEWQAVEAKGVYRRLIADDGVGMSRDELEAFFCSFGGGGKPIGGIHENYGVGSKTSLLPWNHYGIVVVSWKDGEASMIWLNRDPVSGEYGLRVFDSVDETTGEPVRTSVVRPYQDPENGCDWSLVKPKWIEDHGTVVVLLGGTADCSTVAGDPDREEADIKGISSYMNRRMWEFAPGVEVTVEEMMSSDRRRWPTKRDDTKARGSSKPGESAGAMSRTIHGARHYIQYPAVGEKKLGASGAVVLADGTEVDWYLWQGERPGVQSYAAVGGYVATLYRNELYDVTQHHATYRSFGITEATVRSRLWLVLRPVELDPASGRRGIYSRTDRNALLISGGKAAGSPLPIADWAAEFADQMPDAILAAIRAVRATGGGTIDDERWRERLAERFGDRWRITKLRARADGLQSVAPSQPGEGAASLPSIRAAGGGSVASGAAGGRAGRMDTGSAPGPVSAARREVAGGIPSFRRVTAGDVENGMMAAWQPHDHDHPEGVVLLNVEHQVLEAEIRRWQGEYAAHLADQVKDEVIQVFGELAVAKIAHSERLKAVLPTTVVDTDLRSPAALTMALLGLIGSDAILTDRLAGKFRRRAS